MIKLVNKETGAFIGNISQDDLDSLIDNLVEESRDDTDYYINRATLGMLKDNGAPESLVSMIEKAMGESDGIEVKWESV